MRFSNAHSYSQSLFFLSVLMIASITVLLIFVCTKLLLLVTSLHFLITMKNVKWLTYIFIIIKIMLFIYKEKQLLQVASVFFLVIIVLYYFSSIIVIFSFRFFINQELFIVCWHEFKKKKIMLSLLFKFKTLLDIIFKVDVIDN